jgi:hypothetical protein
MYSCSKCGWRGDTPSITDASVERIEHGQVVVDRLHRPVCPKCFEIVAADRETASNG